MTELLNEIRHLIELSSSRHAEARKRGEEYNIFEILGDTSSELAHSAFIANLLEPRGSHGLGSEPLHFFLSCIGEDRWSCSDIDSSSVTVEKCIGEVSDKEGGRMDIVVTSGDKIIIIENKIYAGDQPRQLVRYKSYAESNFAINKLCYLTLDGHDADKISSGKLQSGADYITLSYRNDILRWLDYCIKTAVQRPLIRETIVQYKKTLEQLTNQQMEQDEKHKLYELMLSHAAEIDTIIDNDVACRRYVIENKIIPGLKSLADELGLEFILGKSFLDGKKDVGFAFKRSGWKNILQFEFGGTAWTKLFYGVYSSEKSCSAEKIPGLKKPFGPFIYGWRWITPGNWKHTELSGDAVLNSISEALREIIGILDGNTARYPMV